MRHIAGALQCVEPEEHLSEPAMLDIYAYIDLCLQAIVKSVDQTALAWEGRDYWVKADKFRFEWAWVGEAQRRINQALKQRDDDELKMEAVRLNAKLSETAPYKKDLKAQPWSGSWERWRERETG